MEYNYEDAFAIIKKAQEEDKEKKYENAINLYIEGVEKITNILKCRIIR